MTKPVSVLFVCTGNICRSPTAEGLFREYARRAGIESSFLIDSAGTGGWHQGEAPDARSVMTAMKRGLDISGLRARQLLAKDYSDFDFMIAMDRTHLAHMKQQCPAGAPASMSLLLSHIEKGGYVDVPDPYYGGQPDFDLTYDLIESGVTALLSDLNRRVVAGS